MIEATDLHKHFGKIVAVDGFSFAARDGAITTLLGGNGSGKTTTLRMVAGLIEPLRGRVTIDKRDVRRDRQRALARMGVLHDDFGLYPRLTVREHAAFAAELHGMSGRRARNAVDRALDRVAAADIADRATAGLSHGQRMKTALARAIVHAPKNLVLDEPTRGLDVFALRVLRELLKSLRAEGVAILLSSHAMAEVAELSDEVLVIESGRLVASGAPSDIVAKGNGADLEQAFVNLTNAARKVGA
jgi:sodium transport system ATP-binding protein